MRLLSLFLLAILLLAAAPPMDQAAPSGEAWLGLIDSSKYAESWSEASSYFRMRVPQQQWAAMAHGVRAPLGALVSRKQQSITFLKTLPGAPDGNYAVLQFQTSFQNKASAAETLTVMIDGDKWRCAGYFIK
jgi:hypothetical protein